MRRPSAIAVKRMAPRSPEERASAASFLRRIERAQVANQAHENTGGPDRALPFEVSPTSARGEVAEGKALRLQDQRAPRCLRSAFAVSSFSSVTAIV